MYISTRGNIEKQTAAQAIALGMVPQGGLFVPETIPHVDWQELKGKNYAGLALKIMNLFLDDLPPEVLDEAVKVYGDGRFDTTNPVPLTDVGNCGILELWHGPTAAFKDMALQVLPYLLASSIKTIGLQSEVLILTATSGDTGKAALEGFKDVPGTKIAVFYPDGGVSPVQERQMITTGGSNTYVAAVKGNFDECQTAVKNIFSSPVLKQKLAQKNLVFSSANSINWGRLMPQIVYYFWAYLQAAEGGKIKPGEQINIVVPTGNFGNILAAYYAKRMGLPLAYLICASNKNNVLTDFFRNGVYDSKRPFFLTSSPSMDILISSNFERFLYEMSGRDDEKIRSWFADLTTKGKFEADGQTLQECRHNMIAGWASEEGVAETIRQVYEEFDYLLDPHTAVGMKVYADYRKKNGDETYTVVTSTASPFKFAHHVLNALNGDTGNESDPWEALYSLSERTGWEIPIGLKSLSQKAAQRVTRCNPDEINEYLIREFSLGTCI
ncbi:MAG: threonine synthase [Peptococcaceae bacterium]|nr:threonine synthase [Peptococcaceae bacterium]